MTDQSSKVYDDLAKKSWEAHILLATSDNYSSALVTRGKHLPALSTHNNIHSFHSIYNTVRTLLEV